MPRGSVLFDLGGCCKPCLELSTSYMRLLAPQNFPFAHPGAIQTFADHSLEQTSVLGDTNMPKLQLRGRASPQSNLSKDGIDQFCRIVPCPVVENDLDILTV
jgi:hypothetical protein